MRIGLQLFASRRDGETRSVALARVVEQAQLAEQFGYDVIWLAEHHDTDWNVCPDALTLAAHLAARTSTITIGTAVVNLGIRRAIDVAERAVLVHELSAGRFELGLGRGFAVSDYELYGVDAEISKHRFADDVREVHRYASRAGIPVWLATTGSQSTLRLAAEVNAGLLLATHGTKLNAILATARSLRPALPIALTRAVHTAPDQMAAWPELLPYLEWYRQRLAELQPDVLSPALADVRASFCTVGTPEACAEEIAKYERSIGLSDFVAVVGIAGMRMPVFSACAEALVHAVVKP